ncbi:MAG: glycosyltransferase, partial [Desulfohalobium sp.]
MRIAFVNATHRWGGVKTWMLDVAQALAQRGHAVRLYARPGPFPEAWERTGLCSTTVTFGSDFSLRTIRFFRRAFNSWRPDLLIANVGKDLRTAGIAARSLRIPVIHRVGLPGDMRDKWNVRLMHRLLHPAYLVPCNFIQQGLLRELPFLPPEAVTAIHTGKTPVLAPPSTCSDPLRIIISSQLSPEKGHSDLFAALAQLKDTCAFSCHILGTGPYEAQLQDEATRLGLQPFCTWHGFQTDVRAFLRQSDIFVLPSYREGLPNTLLEAMAEGLIPVARDVGGVREIWPETLNPLLLLSASTAQTWAQTLKTLLQAQSPTLLEYKAASWQACHDNFSLAQQITRLEAW